MRMWQRAFSYDDTCLHAYRVMSLKAMFKNTWEEACSAPGAVVRSLPLGYSAMLSCQG